MSSLAQLRKKIDAEARQASTRLDLTSKLLRTIESYVSGPEEALAVLEELAARVRETLTSEASGPRLLPPVSVEVLRGSPLLRASPKGRNGRTQLVREIIERRGEVYFDTLWPEVMKAMGEEGNPKRSKGRTQAILYNLECMSKEIVSARPDASDPNARLLKWKGRPARAASR